MFRNYFIISVRNLVRNRFYSAINIAGLAIGLACFVLSMLYVNDELKYDRFHRKADRIYRVCEELNTEGSGENSSSVPFPVAPAMMNDYGHLIEKAVRFFNFQDTRHALHYEEKNFNESNIYVVDSSVFELFDFPLERGDPATALLRPQTIVLSQDLAVKYFGQTDPVGKIIKYDGVVNLEVTGVMKPLPPQSHMQFDALISFSSLPHMLGWQYGKNWVWNPCWTYILLRPGADPGEIEREFPDFVQKYYPDFLKNAVRHYLQPLTGIHLDSRLAYEMRPNGDADNIYIFSLTGIFILVIAAINFMNLSTARSAKRSMEIGIRKVLGAHRGQLIRQLLVESVIVSLLAVLLSLLLIELLLPFFNSIAGKELRIGGEGSVWLLLLLSGAGLVTGLLSGIYPAFYLSSFEPVQVLRKKVPGHPGRVPLRKLLVVLQFTVSLILITSTWVIYRQLNYLRSAHLGFDKEQVLVLPVRPPMFKQYDAFISQLRENSSVLNVTYMNDLIGKHHNTHEYNYPGMEPDKWVYFPSLLVDEEFIPTMNMQLLAGRNFSKDFPRDDSLAVIINEAMLERMGWKSPEEALGKQFFTPSGSEKVVGIVKDFHFEPLHNPVGPFVLDMPHRRLKIFWTRHIAIRLAPGNLTQQLAGLEETWNGISKDFPFDYFFLRDDLNNQYVAQEKLARLFTGFSCLTVFIACLGLLALSAYSAEQRTKEIGIRKTMGASVISIVQLLSVDFMKLVLLANLIALPLTWLLMQAWLENFAFRIPIPAAAFLVAAFISLFISFFTLSIQSVRAALTNPIQSLRYE